MRSPFRKRRSQAGFTFVELLVAAIGMVIILTVSTQLMFAMRRGIVRQQLQVDARQNARAALDYTTMLLRGATDSIKVPAGMGTANNPASILPWLWSVARCTSACTPLPSPVVCPGYGGCYQVSYNNVTTVNNSHGILADEGTDIITFARATNPISLKALSRWPTFDTATEVRWNAVPFCTANNNNVANAFAAFKAVTGESGNKSMPLLLADDVGNFRLYQITDYQTFDTCTETGTGNAYCRDPGDAPTIPSGEAICFKLKATPTDDATVNPPGSRPQLNQPHMNLGMSYTSLRVRTDPVTGIPWLEQKDGPFDAAVDKPGGAFVPILPNIEDLQIAYIFLDGSVRNSSAATRLAGTGGVPRMGTFPATNDDITGVVGFRITITGRSGQGMPIETNRFRRPASEDHDAGTTPDTVYRYTLTANAMMRNRMSGA
jgi:type II secretory pathway pseudopilin PulG